MAIKITLSPPDTEPTTYTQSFISWRVLKAVIRLGLELSDGELTDERRDDLMALVCEIFNHRFDFYALENGAEIGDYMAVLNAVIQKANSVMVSKQQPSSAPSDTEWMTRYEVSIVNALGWSLRDIDETDIDSLFRFVKQRNEGSEPESDKSYCDQVTWL